MSFEENEFWCELVINGVGGRTIAEAKQRISHSEYLVWKAYREKRGSLFIGRRVEQAIGNWMAHYTRFKVKKGTNVDAKDFMPNEDRPKPSTFEEERIKALKKRESLK